MKNKKATADTIVGIFVLTGLATLLAVTFVIRQDVFRSTMPIWVTFESVSGLEVGAPVLVSGVGGGRVVRIEYQGTTRHTYPEQLEMYGGDIEVDRPVRVRLNVRRDIPIYSNARVRLAMQGFIGDRRVEIDPGEPGPGIVQVQEGDVLAGAPIFDFEKVFGEGRVLVDEVQQAVRGFRDLVTDDETIREMRAAIVETRMALEQVNRYLAANEDDIREVVRNSTTVMANAASITEDARAWFEPGGDVARILAQAEAAIEQLRAESSALLLQGASTAETAERAIESFDQEAARVAASAAQLLDALDADRERLLADLEESRDRVDSILARLQRGEGVAGRLLVDAQPFEDLKASISALHGFLVGPPGRRAELRYVTRPDAADAEPATP